MNNIGYYLSYVRIAAWKLIRSIECQAHDVLKKKNLGFVSNKLISLTENGFEFALNKELSDEIAKVLKQNYNVNVVDVNDALVKLNQILYVELFQDDSKIRYPPPYNISTIYNNELVEIVEYYLACKEGVCEQDKYLLFNRDLKDKNFYYPTIPFTENWKRLVEQSIKMYFKESSEMIVLATDGSDNWNIDATRFKKVSQYVTINHMNMAQDASDVKSRFQTYDKIFDLVRSGTPTESFRRVVMHINSTNYIKMRISDVKIKNSISKIEFWKSTPGSIINSKPIELTTKSKTMWIVKQQPFKDFAYRSWLEKLGIIKSKQIVIGEKAIYDVETALINFFEKEKERTLAVQKDEVFVKLYCANSKLGHIREIFDRILGYDELEVRHLQFILANEYMTTVSKLDAKFLLGKICQITMQEVLMSMPGAYWIYENSKEKRSKLRKKMFFTHVISRRQPWDDKEILDDIGLFNKVNWGIDDFMEYLSVVENYQLPCRLDKIGPLWYEDTNINLALGANIILDLIHGYYQVTNSYDKQIDKLINKTKFHMWKRLRGEWEVPICKYPRRQYLRRNKDRSVVFIAYVSVDDEEFNPGVYFLNRVYICDERKNTVYSKELLIGDNNAINEVHSKIKSMSETHVLVGSFIQKFLGLIKLASENAPPFVDLVKFRKGSDSVTEENIIPWFLVKTYRMDNFVAQYDHTIESEASCYRLLYQKLILDGVEIYQKVNWDIVERIDRFTLPPILYSSEKSNDESSSKRKNNNNSALYNSDGDFDEIGWQMHKDKGY